MLTVHLRASLKPPIFQGLLTAPTPHPARLEWKCPVSYFCFGPHKRRDWLGTQHRLRLLSHGQASVIMNTAWSQPSAGHALCKGYYCCFLLPCLRLWGPWFAWRALVDNWVLTTKWSFNHTFGLSSHQRNNTIMGQYCKRSCVFSGNTHVWVTTFSTILLLQGRPNLWAPPMKLVENYFYLPIKDVTTDFQLKAILIFAVVKR